MAGPLPAPRSAELRTIADKEGRRIDRGLVLYFPAPHSFTGEDCAEFQIHGGNAVIKALLSALRDLGNLRSAEPGEFTRRAFENGKMDLTAVEGLADLVSAETEAQRRMALEQASGRLGSIYEDWRGRLVRARAMIEADFDFSDEEDVPKTVAAPVWEDVRALAADIGKQLDSVSVGEIIREGYRIAIVGAPNAGKSSLLNALARRNIAIVSEEAGTTRDVLTVELDIAGYPVILQDTAGLREEAGAVEKEGMRRALLTAEAADLVLELRDLSARDESAAAKVKAKEKLVIGTKRDLVPFGGTFADCTVSTRTGEGLDDLINLLRSRVEGATLGVGTVIPNRQRHREYLQRTLSFLEEALDPGIADELRAESLRLAGDMIGRLTGKIDVEDLLDVIFSEFCIGK